MAITYGQIKDMSLQLIDEYSSRGVTQSPTKTADYRFKIQTLTNATIYDLATSTAKIPASFSIVHNPIQNNLSDDTSLIKTHLPGQDFSISLPNAKATFFETTGPATIIIEESAGNGAPFSPLETIDVPANQVAFAEYRRLISPSSPSHIVRLRFTGDYVYDFRNYILYQYSFPSENDIQQHRPYFLIDLPDDFLEVNTVFIRRDQRQYLPYTNFNITPGPDQKFSFNSYEFPIELEVNYWRKPKLLEFSGNSTTDRALEIDLADEAALIIPWNVAGELLKSEKQLPEGTLLINQYQAKKSALRTNKTDFLGISYSPYGW